MTQKIMNDIADGIVSGLKPGVALADAFEQAQMDAGRDQIVEALMAIAKTVKDLVDIIMDAIVEFYATVVKIVVPPLKRVVKQVFLFSQRMGIYHCLLPFIGGTAAWWIAHRLPDWIVLRLPQRWVLLL